MRKVKIAGVGCTSFGRYGDMQIVDLAAIAAEQAIAESGLERERIGALYLGNFVAGVLNGQEVLAGLVGDALRLANVPCTKVEGACASGGIAFRHACLAVASGVCDVAIAVGVEKMTHASTAEMTAALNCAMDQAADASSGLTFPGVFGMAYRVYESRYGASREQISSVVIKNKGNGLRNPLAQMGAELDAETIANSALIADPLRLYDCCPASDGAAAVLVCADHIDLGRTAIDVAATVQTRGAPRSQSIDDPCRFEATVSAGQRALEDAGISVIDLSLVELHDCFSVAEIVDSEDLGLMPRGHGAGWAHEGRTSVGGDLPINASGGLLSKGHPVGATGLSQIFEAVQQLRGTHPNQVDDAKIAMTHNLGGMGVACTVNILKRDDV